MLREILPELSASFALLTVCVVIHSAGLGIALRRLASKPIAGTVRRRVYVMRAMVLTAIWLLSLHLVEIVVFGLFIAWNRILPDLETAVYFSGVTYATVGYGDVVLPHDWRLLGPIEGLTGILMCGLSTGFFFAVVTKVYAELRQATQGD